MVYVITRRVRTLVAACLVLLNRVTRHFAVTWTNVRIQVSTQIKFVRFVSRLDNRLAFRFFFGLGNNNLQIFLLVYLIIPIQLNNV